MDGSVFLPFLSDFNMEHNASLPAFIYSNAPGSLTEISFLEFGRAVHRTGHIVRAGHQRADHEVVAIIANLDTLLYQTLIAGLMRAGLVVSFPQSPMSTYSG